jgi:hypothetical protein
MKKYGAYNLIFWAAFVGFVLGGFAMMVVTVTLF